MWDTPLAIPLNLWGLELAATSQAGVWAGVVAIIIFLILLFVIAPLIRILCHLTIFTWSSCTQVLNTEQILFQGKTPGVGLPFTAHTWNPNTFGTNFGSYYNFILFIFVSL